MDLSPNDIRNYEFPNQMRGYDKEEVDNLLEQVAQALEEARQQNLKLSMEVDSLKTQLAGLKEFEDTIKNAAIDARRNADSTVAHAKKEAAEILAKAKKEAAELIVAQDHKLEDLRKQLGNLEQTKKSYIAQLRNLINSHMDMVDEIATADVKRDIHGETVSSPAKDKLVEAEQEAVDEHQENGIEVEESTDVTRQNLETLASKPGEEAITTEEANAADNVIPCDEPEAFDEAKAEPDHAKAEPAVDPELAAALKKYHSDEDVEKSFGPVPPQGAIIETSRTAEDIPPGFIAKVSEAEIKAAKIKAKSIREAMDDTGKLDDEDSSSDLAPDAQDRPTEHNAIDMDKPTSDDVAKKDVSPDELAQALDSVVSKFEEEMEKAEKR